MNLQRITRVQVAIAGMAVVVGIALIFFFLFVNPQRKAIDKATLDAEYWEGENTRRPRVEEEIREAEATEEEVTAKYEEILETRMPKLDFTDPIGATVRMWDLAEEEQRLMGRWFASTGARVTGYSFPNWGANMPGSFPNPAWTHLDPLSWNLTIEVEDFPELLEWLLKIPEAPRFMELQNVTIQGPRQPGQPLVAQIPVMFYQWTGVEPAAAPAPSAGAATTGRGMGGRGMGGRGGRGMGGRGMGGRGMGGRGMGGRGGRGGRGF